MMMHGLPISALLQLDAMIKRSHRVSNFLQYLLGHGCIQETLEHCVLRIDDTARRRTDGDIVGQDNKLDVQNGAGAYPPDVYPRAILEVPVQARLWPVGLVVHGDALHGGRGAPLGLHVARVRPEDVGDTRRRGRRAAREVHRHAFGVALEHGHPIAGRRDDDGVGVAHVERLVVVDDLAEDLGRFALHFGLFVGDVRHDVVEDVEGGDTGVSGSRNGLHGCHHALVDRTKGFLQRVERNDEARRRAVGIGDYKTSHEVM